VKSRRDANFIYNRISDHRVEELVNTLQALFCEPPVSERTGSEAAV
jgi:hypothetical protein